jgi:hypothetical protein
MKSSEAGNRAIAFEFYEESSIAQAVNLANCKLGEL